MMPFHLRRHVYLHCAAALLILPAPGAIADTEYMDAEENIADFLISVESLDYLLPARIPGESRPLDPAKRQWAFLPQIGYGVYRKIKIPGTLLEARKGTVKASPEVHERRIRSRKGPLRVERRGFAGILSM